MRGWSSRWPRSPIPWRGSGARSSSRSTRLWIAGCSAVGLTRSSGWASPPCSRACPSCGSGTSRANVGIRRQPIRRPPPTGSPLDVLVCLGKPLAPGDLPFVVRHGIWYLHLGDPRRYRDEPALFWEVFFAEPASKAALEAVDDTPEEPRLLYQSTTATDPISLHRTRNAAYWKSARFVLRRLEDLAARRWTPELELAGPRDGRRRHSPSNADAVRHMARARRAGHEAQAPSRRFSHANGSSAFGGDEPDILPHEDPSPWQVVSPPVDRQWADPFVFERDGETLVFFEQLRYARCEG